MINFAHLAIPEVPERNYQASCAIFVSSCSTEVNKTSTKTYATFTPPAKKKMGTSCSFVKVNDDRLIQLGRLKKSFTGPLKGYPIRQCKSF